MNKVIPSLILAGGAALTCLIFKKGLNKREKAYSDPGSHRLHEKGQEAVCPGSGKGPPPDKANKRLDQLSLEIAVELGQTTLPLNTILSLAKGSLIQFDGPAYCNALLFVNGRPWAHGQVVILSENFGVRLTEMEGG